MQRRWTATDPTTARRDADRPAARAGRASWAVVALVSLAALVLAGCSSDGSDGSEGGGSATTGDAPIETSAPDASTTTVAGNGIDDTPATTTTTAAPVDDPTDADYAGEFQGVDATVTFHRTADALTDFEVSEVELACLPLGDGDPSTRTTTVSVAEVPVGDGGSVDFAAEDEAYDPAITGTFADDGTFAATIYFSGQRDDASCGAELALTATPVG